MFIVYIFSMHLKNDISTKTRIDKGFVGAIRLLAPIALTKHAYCYKCICQKIVTKTARGLTCFVV